MFTNQKNESYYSIKGDFSMDFPQAFISAGAEYADIEHFVPAPFFRKKFTAGKTETAEIIIGATGFYRLFLNGKDITKGFRYYLL